MAKKDCFVIYVDNDKGITSIIKFATIEEAKKEILKQYDIDRVVPSSIIIGESCDVDIKLEIRLKEKS